MLRIYLKWQPVSHLTAHLVKGQTQHVITAPALSLGRIFWCKGRAFSPF